MNYFRCLAWCGLLGWGIVLPVSSISQPLSSSSLRSLQVYPESFQLTADPGQYGQGLLVTGQAEDGFDIDLTGRVHVEIADPQIAQISSNRWLRGVAPGETVLTVRYQGFTHRLPVKVTVPDDPNLSRPSFVRDVLPLLSKMGCNAGPCHAKPNGQNGFKLSVFAYDPESDYRQIVVESRGRRVFPASPLESLLLQKPTLAVPHEGGRRFDPGSEAYETIVRWINQGLVYRHPNEADLKEIEIYPRERRYHRGAEQPVLVRAHYTDGRIRDITHLAEFISTQKDLAVVDDEGRLRVAEAAGEATLIARYMGLVALSRVTVPGEHMLPPDVYAALPRNNFIDDLAYAHFQKLGLLPSDACTDEEFLRRASLDVTGTLPSPEEALAFLHDHSPEKRNQLIDRLLKHPTYADHWAVKWADLLRPNPFRVGVKSVYVMDEWLRESFRENKPYAQFAREILTAQGSTHQWGPAVIYRDRREPADQTTLVSQIFLGTRLECAKCHHHPNEKWSQADFYQFAAYFGQLKRKGTGISPPISGSAEYFFHAPGGEVRHPVTGEVMKPKPPDAPPSEIPPGRDPREVLAEWMMTPDNPFFARAAVNRIWGEFFGRGLVEPVDDFRTSNPASIGPLLDALAEDFVAHGYDYKHLMRTILRSHLYQLSSLPNDTNREDTRYFSRAYRRRLPAEVLLDTVSRVTGTSDTLQGLPPGARAMESWNNRLDSQFMDAFGRPDPSADCPCERVQQGSVVQALHLMNSNELQGKIAAKNGRAATLAESSLSEAEIVRELYLATYNRPPTDEEIQLASQAFHAEGATRQTATEDILWALLNSAEFVFNH